MRLLIVFLSFVLSAGLAQADVIDEHTTTITGLSEDACRQEEQSYRQLYGGNDRKVAGTISFLAEGTRLLCETIRLRAEFDRLSAEQRRLRGEAARLEAAWQSAHSIAPRKYPDYPGRDRSQKRLLADAERIGGTMSVLRNVIDDLTAESRRILTLASDEFDLLDRRRSDLVLASLDGEDEYDILIRLLKRNRVST